MRFFFDRNFGTRVPIALELLGLPVEWHDKHFTTRTSDTVWLAQAGRHGWIVITRDKRIRLREHERAVLVEAGVGCFILSGGGQGRWDVVRLIASTWDRIVALSTSTPPPFIFLVYKSGEIRKVYPVIS